MLLPVLVSVPLRLPPLPPTPLYKGGRGGVGGVGGVGDVGGLIEGARYESKRVARLFSY